ncbi:MAG TPA: cell envelope integrity protein CreD [Acidobacteriaceae bacterium]|nr:cell envelope integrity protein CreD [Acidobacteriaceae bacterium]
MELPTSDQVRAASRSIGFKLSMGLKLIVVCFLALLMCIPSFFVSSLVDDRKTSQASAVDDISSHVGGAQTFLGPTLAIPYTTPPPDPKEAPGHGIYIVFPAQASASVKTTTEERHRSLFKVPVFNANLKLDAAFDLRGVPADLPTGATLDWSKAEIIVGVSDARGALADATLVTPSSTDTLAPAAIAQSWQLSTDENGHGSRLTLFGANQAALAKPNAQFNVSANLKFSGAQRIAVLAYGKTTHVTAQGDWPNPSFDGGFLPAGYGISQSGFSANWSVPFIARGIRAEGPVDTMRTLDATALGTSFVELADPYQSVNRSLKYVLLFLGFVFLAYFVFEVSTHKRVHPAQYILVGIAQIIFYLLLLSLAERIGFDWSFLIAGAATVILFSLNAAWIFASRTQGIQALAVFSVLYSLIYVLLRLQDDALLVGAVASFVAIAVAMYLTRRIDWYSSLPPAGSPDPPSVVPQE